MSALDSLREEVCEANRALPARGLVTLTWGNVSGIDASREVVAIKASGVPYGDMKPADVVLVALDGRVVEGALLPSTDTPAHLEIYRAWEHVGGVVHTHSDFATAFAQARRPIPCLGTTHADHFAGEVPVTRQLEPGEVESGYEAATARLIVERFQELDPVRIPGVLVAGHGPFVWGRSATRALENAVALEAVARMAHATLALGGGQPLEPHLLAKHQDRKHGPSAYYGQAT